MAEEKSRKLARVETRERFVESLGSSSERVCITFIFSVALAIPR